MQKLAEICVRRPVFATMLILALTVVGAFAFFALGVDRLPNADFPVVTVTVLYPGASPEQVEREITDRVEGAVNTVSGITELTSTSVEGLANIVVTFQLSKNGDIAAQEVRQKVDLVANDLPATARAPIVRKVDVGASAVMLYAVTSPRSLVDTTDLVQRQIVEKLQSVAGVGSVAIYGGRKREVQISVDPLRLRAYGLTAVEVSNALRAQNVEMPAGAVNGATERRTLRTLGKVERLADFPHLVLGTRDGYPIRLRDVAYVEDEGAPPDSIATRNEESAVVLAVQKQSGKNTVAVIEAIKERMAELVPTLPPDLKVHLARDQSEFIYNALHAIEEHLLLGGFLAAAVVYLFLRNFRSTIIAALAIPSSTIAAFAVMYLLGYTLNMMTMLALTLMVGIVIDDAIIVLENIYRFVEEKGLNSYEAAIEGTREIGLAVLATTLSLLAVFVPIGFMGGVVGRFMSSFGFTAAAAIAVSLLVSFTLTPMLAARWIERHPPSAHQPAGWYAALDRLYTRALEWSLAHRWTVAGSCVLVTLSTIPLGQLTGVTFLPPEDEHEFQVAVRQKPGASLAAAQSVMEAMAREIRTTLPGVEATLAIGGYNEDGLPHAGSIFVRLKTDRTDSTPALMARARALLAERFPGVYTALMAADSPGGGSRDTAITYVLAGPDTTKLEQYSAQLLERMRKSPLLVDVDRSVTTGRPELRLTIDRERAADQDVRVADLAATLNTLYAGERVGSFSEGKNQYDVVVRAQRAAREDASALANLTAPSQTGIPVDLKALVFRQPADSLSNIDRIGRERQVTLFANLPPGGSEADAIAEINRFVTELKLEPDYRPVLTGNAKLLNDAGSAFGVAVLLSFLFMYMVLAAQFESFLHPITILLTLPLSVPFGLLATWAAGMQLNIFSGLGILLLFGVVKKNAILQIAHTNELRAQGMNRHEAMMLANRNRLRPILMTTIALVAGMIPLVLGSGPGAATNRSIGVLVVGGQSLCLLLTLLAVPVFYSLFEDASAKLRWPKRGKLASVVRMSVIAAILVGTVRADDYPVNECQAVCLHGQSHGGLTAGRRPHPGLGVAHVSKGSRLSGTEGRSVVVAP